MRAILASALLAFLALAGCASSGSGTLTVHVTDAPGAIGEFQSLTVEVSGIVLKSKGSGGEEKGTTYTPSSPSFDLVKLVDGNLTTLFSGTVANGTYTRMELEISKASGVLKSGAAVEVKAPKGSIFVNTPFTVGDGSDVHFLFDLHVVGKGNGEYSLQPNADGSKTIAKPTGGKVPK